MVPFHKPTRVPEELERVAQVLSGAVPADHFNKICDRLLEERLGVSYATLTPSCTHALEMSALALEIAPGDEVIVPAFTFTSTANAFLLRGANLVFADITPDTLNMDPASLERSITPRTRAIVLLHYAGISCDMDAIMGIANAAGIPVVEDAAHALFGSYRGRQLGTIGAAGTFSFHRTKNFTCDEGGAFLSSDRRLSEAAEMIREKGTNRSQFMRGLVHKYQWVREGSSYILADMLAAQLSAQLERATEIQEKRKAVFLRYQTGLADWAESEGVHLPEVTAGCDPAWHLHYMVMSSEETRDAFLDHLRARNIGAAFHYVALHLTPMGRRLGGKPGDAPVSERSASSLVRLPFYTDLSENDQSEVIDAVRSFRMSKGRPASSARSAEVGAAL